MDYSGASHKQHRARRGLRSPRALGVVRSRIAHALKFQQSSINHMVNTGLLEFRGGIDSRENNSRHLWWSPTAAGLGQSVDLV